MAAPVSGAAFWSLMARWGIDDATALELIDQPQPASGKRPRFALTTGQAERLALLRGIEQQGEALGLRMQDWLAGDGAAALAQMAEGRDGIAAVLHDLQLRAFGGSVKAARKP